MIVRILEGSIGCILVVAGVVGKSFVWGGPGVGRGENAKPFSTKLGRAIFLVGGFWFIYLALTSGR